MWGDLYLPGCRLFGKTKCEYEFSVFLVPLQETSVEELTKLKDRIMETREELDDVLPLFQSQKDEEEKLNSL